MPINWNKIIPRWSGDVIEPPESKKDTGYIAGDKPPAKWENWLRKGTYEALEETREVVEGIDSELAQIATTAELGRVKIDGETIKITEDGKISADNASKMKTLSLTRDLSLTGTQIISGVGFKPKRIIINLGKLNTPAQSTGVWDGENITIIFRREDNTVSIGTQHLGIITNSASNTALAQCLLGAVSEDSFELIWSKTGSPTGTGLLQIVALG